VAVGERCAFRFCWECLADRNIVGSYGNHHHDPSCSHWQEPGQVQAVRDEVRAFRARRDFGARERAFLTEAGL